MKKPKTEVERLKGIKLSTQALDELLDWWKEGDCEVCPFTKRGNYWECFGICHRLFPFTKKRYVGHGSRFIYYCPATCYSNERIPEYTDGYIIACVRIVLNANRKRRGEKEVNPFGQV